MPTMQDVEAALKSLEAIIGHRVFLTDPPAKIEQSCVTDREGCQVAPGRDDGTTHISEQTTKGASAARSVESATTNTTMSAAPLDDTMGGQQQDTLPYVGLKPQALGDDNLTYCPWKVVLTYPDCFTGKANRPRVRCFFDNIFSYRDWNFFYIRHANDMSRAHLLVPTIQVENFLRLINKSIGTQLCIPKGAPSRGFFLKFADCGPFRPRYLLHCSKRENHSTSAAAGGTSSHATTRSNTVVSGFDLDDAKTWPRDDDKMTHGAYAQLSPEALARYQAHMKDLKRDPVHTGKGKLSAERRQAIRQERWLEHIAAMRGHIGLDGDDPEVRRASDVVLCALDVESIETAPHPVSEVGIAILDMQKVGEKPSGRRGKEWWPLIEAHHMRIKEYSGLVNRRYCHGCPEDFQFGESTLPDKKDVKRAIQDLLAPYATKKRHVVLVGHAMGQDLKHLVDVDVDMTRLVGDEKDDDAAATVAATTMDTQVLHQAWRQSNRQVGLESMLNELRFEYSYLHNAGNDAVHTLRAAVGLAFVVADKERAKAKKLKSRAEGHVSEEELSSEAEWSE